MISLTRSRFTVLMAGFLMILPAGFLVMGYYLGATISQASPDELNLALQSELETQRLTINEATRTAKENMDALALQLGNLQSHIIRIDALGQRLTSMAKLDKGEFDFTHPPAQGGPDEHTKGISGESMAVPDFIKSLEDLSSQIADRSQQLAVLEEMMMNRNLEAEVLPAGRPITRGWLSSYFGMRNDPFTGRRVHHSGIDFAGKMGSDVVAVAAGVVTYAGRRSGYGNLVEINHGKGYSTRYGHNSKILVKLGQMVKKGERISLMGSSGRSTGPHVHFEVLHNGRSINPIKYIHASR